MNAFSEEDNTKELINLVSIPNGMEPWEDRNDIDKLSEVISRVMPRELEQLVTDINRKDVNEITCIIADERRSWNKLR